MNEYWEGIIGQSSAKDILNNLINTSKIPHAFLFQGLDGLGKEFTAIKFAQLLNEKFSDSENKNVINKIKFMISVLK